MKTLLSLYSILLASNFCACAQTQNELDFEFDFKVKVKHSEHESAPIGNDIEIFFLHGPAKFYNSKYEVKKLSNNTFNVLIRGTQEYLDGGEDSFFGNLVFQIKKKAKELNVYADDQYANYYLALNGYNVHDNSIQRKSYRQTLKIKMKEPLELNYKNQFIVATKKDEGPSFEYYAEYLLCDAGVNYFPYLTSRYRTAPKRFK